MDNNYLYGISAIRDSKNADDAIDTTHAIVHEMKHIMRTPPGTNLLMRNIRTGTSHLYLAIGCKWSKDRGFYTVSIVPYNNDTGETYDTVKTSELKRLANLSIRDDIVGMLSAENVNMIPKDIQDILLTNLHRMQQPEFIKKQLTFEQPEKIYMSSQAGFYYGRILSCVKPEINEQFNFYDGYEDFLTCQLVTYGDKSKCCATYDKDWCVVPVEFLRKDSGPKLKQLHAVPVKKKDIIITRKNGKPLIDGKYAIGIDYKDTKFNEFPTAPPIAKDMLKPPKANTSKENTDLTNLSDITTATENNFEKE